MAALLTAGPARAEDKYARSGGYEVLRSAGRGDVVFLKPVRRSLQAARPIPAARDAASQAAAQFLPDAGALFGLGGPPDRLAPRGGGRDELHVWHFRYQQLYRGIPVLGGGVTLHLGPNLSLRSASGRILPKIRLRPGLKTLRGRARRAARRYWRKLYSQAAPKPARADPYVLSRGFLRRTAADHTRLVWMVKLQSPALLRGDYFIIDARTYRLVHRLPAVQSGIERRVWDCGADGENCYLDQPFEFDSTSVILGRSLVMPARVIHPAPFPDAELGRNLTNDIYDWLGAAYGYYRGVHARTGCNDAGGLGIGAPNFPAAATSAVSYLEGIPELASYCPNAFFDNYGAIWFCSNAAALDVLAHEYTHSVVFDSVRDPYGNPFGLAYEGESGALNEAYADIFGAAVEAWARPGRGNWLIGEDTAAWREQDGLRSLSDPPSYYDVLGPMPDRRYSLNVYCGDLDHYGVHHNATIPSKAAYLMAAGGSFNGCRIEAIGREREEKVFYRALTWYLDYASDFNDAYHALITACGDLYDAGVCLQVIRALRAVEMDQAGLCSDEPRRAPECLLPDPDLRPPVLNISRPVSGRTVTGGLRIRFTDDEPLAPECSPDGKHWTPCRSGVTRLKDLAGLTALKRGSRFSLRVRDRDASGNLGMDEVRDLRKSGAVNGVSRRKRIQASLQS